MNGRKAGLLPGDVSVLAESGASWWKTGFPISVLSMLPDALGYTRRF
ncbi:hypothetical protein AB5I39_03230 [Sphingomonas sp. MMS24-J45]